MFRAKKFILFILDTDEKGHLKCLTKSQSMQSATSLLGGEVDYFEDVNVLYAAAHKMMQLAYDNQWTLDIWDEEFKRILNVFFLAGFNEFDDITETAQLFVFKKALSTTVLNDEKITQLTAANDNLRWSDLQVSFNLLNEAGIHGLHLMDYVIGYQEKYNVELKWNSIMERFKLKESVENQKAQYAIIVCEDHYDWSTHVEMIPYGLFCTRADQCWKVYDATQHHLPSDEEMTTLKGLVLTGGRHSVYQDTPWIQELITFCKPLTEKYPQLRTLGICFGAQLLTVANGGNVSKYQGDFIFNTEYIYVNSDFLTKSWAQRSLIKGENMKTLNMHESHQDYIDKLPPKALVLGSSDKIANEIWSIDNQVLAMQFHPECNYAIFDKILKVRLYRNKFIDDRLKAIAEETFLGRQPHYYHMREICTKFLCIPM
mmetsp:Transcript_64463/g.74025  ORF Transcript_64463/g.74025 Transcript_64463/m.74025 type:complete len:429 (-) Transcript_64463:13-1299(-)